MATQSIFQSQPQPITFNHDEWLRRFGVIFALVGVGISLYLSYAKLANAEVACTKTSVIDCAGVQNSAYSEIGGISIAFLGVIGYGAIALGLAFQNHIGLLKNYGHALLFSVTLFGFIYSLFLTYVEGFVLEKWCLWCVASALTMTGLFMLSIARLVYSMQVLEDETN